MESKIPESFGGFEEKAFKAPEEGHRLGGSFTDMLAVTGRLREEYESAMERGKRMIADPERKDSMLIMVLCGHAKGPGSGLGIILRWHKLGPPPEEHYGSHTVIGTFAAMSADEATAKLVSALESLKATPGFPAALEQRTIETIAMVKATNKLVADAKADGTFGDAESEAINKAEADLNALVAELRKWKRDDAL